MKFGGKILDKSALDGLWPIEGIIHPGLTVITGQPLAGKTTLALALAKAVLGNEEWLGHRVNFPERSRVLFMAENAMGVRRALDLNDPYPGRVYAAQTTQINDGADCSEEVRALSIGLVVIDSAWTATGDLNDGKLASGFLTAIRNLGVPVIVIHHEAKGLRRGAAGSQAWTAAYEHFIQVTPQGTRGGLDLKIWGNDTKGRESLRIVLPHDGSPARIRRANENTTQTGSARPVQGQWRMTAQQRGEALLALARENGIQLAGLTAGEAASQLLGGPQGASSYPSMGDVCRAAWPDKKTVSWKTVKETLRHVLPT